VKGRKFYKQVKSKLNIITVAKGFSPWVNIEKGHGFSQIWVLYWAEAHSS